MRLQLNKQRLRFRSYITCDARREKRISFCKAVPFVTIIFNTRLRSPSRHKEEIVLNGGTPSPSRVTRDRWIVSTEATVFRVLPSGDFTNLLLCARVSASVLYQSSSKQRNLLLEQATYRTDYTVCKIEQVEVDGEWLNMFFELFSNKYSEENLKFSFHVTKLCETCFKTATYRINYRASEMKQVEINRR